MGVVECQGILEGCLPLSTLSVTPAYSLVTGVSGQRSALGLGQSIILSGEKAIAKLSLPDVSLSQKTFLASKDYPYGE